MDLEIFPSLFLNILIIFLSQACHGPGNFPITVVEYFDYFYCPRLAMDLEKTNALNARQKEEYNKLTNDFNGLQV